LHDASQCASGYCKDGKCCDSACTSALPDVRLGHLQHRHQRGRRGYLHGQLHLQCERRVPLQERPGLPSGASQCASNICTDGYCCNASCGSLCEACNVSGYVGTCTAIRRDGPGEECTGTGTCGGTCSGSGRVSTPVARSAAHVQGLQRSRLLLGHAQRRHRLRHDRLRRLDTICRNYSDLTSSRCKAFGTCKVANSSTARATPTPGPAPCAWSRAARVDLLPGRHLQRQWTCVDNGSSSCGLYLCSGSVCGTSCTGDAQCVSSAYCVARAAPRRSPTLGLHGGQRVPVGGLRGLRVLRLGIVQHLPGVQCLGPRGVVLRRDERRRSRHLHRHNTCNSSGQCKVKNGQACPASPTECVNSTCADGVCWQ